MEKSRITPLFTIFLAMIGFTTAAHCAPKQLKIPNFSSQGPACALTFIDNIYRCTANGCDIPTSKSKGAEVIHLSFSCLPKTSPTGFENPPDYVKVEFIQSKNTKGEISFTEDIETPSSKRAIDLNFCLYGKSNNLCGFSRLLKPETHVRSTSGDTIKSFLKGIELKETLCEKPK
jgi:hypothetical protein